MRGDQARSRRGRLSARRIRQVARSPPPGRRRLVPTSLRRGGRATERRGQKQASLALTTRPASRTTLSELNLPRRWRDRETRRDRETERQKDGETEGRRDRGITRSNLPVSLSLCLSVSPSLRLCVAVAWPMSQSCALWF